MKPTSVLSVAVGAAGLTLFTWLLVRGSLSGAQYVVTLPPLALLCVAIPCFPRLRELDLKNLRMVLGEIRQVRDEIAEMYGGIDNLRRAPLVLDDAKMKELGLERGHIARIDAVMQYPIGCMKWERERLARIFVAPKTPERLAEAILDGSMDDMVFKWNGPETPLDARPVSVDERAKAKGGPPPKAT